MTTRKKKHLFRKTHSLGLNAKLLTSNEIPFEWIIIEFDGKKLETSRQYFLKKGKIFSFSKRGFEKQAFLPIAEFGLNKAFDFKKKSCEQEDLFAVAI